MGITAAPVGAIRRNSRKRSVRNADTKDLLLPSMLWMPAAKLMISKLVAVVMRQKQMKACASVLSRLTQKVSPPTGDDPATSHGCLAGDVWNFLRSKTALVMRLLPAAIICAALVLNAYAGATLAPIQMLSRYGLEGKKAFAILSKPESQRDLALTTNQLTRIKAIRNVDARAMPSVSNLLMGTRAPGDISQRLRRSEEVLKLADSFQLENFYAVLSNGQSNRLQQIRLQVCGLRSVISNQSLAKALAVSDDQLKEFQHIVAQHDLELDPLYRRFGRQTVAGLLPGESPERRSSEVKALIDSICAIERKMEGEFGGVLSNPQQEEWKRLKGTLLEISWEYNDFMDFMD
jgi:hypothetical protein